MFGWIRAIQIASEVACHYLCPDKGPSFFSLVIPLILATGLTSAESLPITAYTTAEGLAHNHINRIRQDSRGYLWFCTDGGLSRFDGYRFKNYTTEERLPHPWVNNLLEARDRNILDCYRRRRLPIQSQRTRKQTFGFGQDPNSLRIR